MRKMEPNAENSAETRAQAEKVLPSLSRVVEELEAFQETLEGRDPRLELDVDLEGFALPEACLESLERLGSKVRDPEALVFVEQALIEFEASLSGLTQLDLQIEVEQEDPAERVLFSELLTGFQKTLNTVRTLME